MGFKCMRNCRACNKEYAIEIGNKKPGCCSDNCRIERLKFLKKNKRIKDDFYNSKEWKTVRYKTLAIHGNSCMACGRSPKDKIIIHVDHIKPRKDFPKLELEISNLQVLCDDCNLGKSNLSMENWDDYKSYQPTVRGIRENKKEKRLKKQIKTSEKNLIKQKSKLCVHGNYKQFYEKQIFSNGTLHYRKTCSGCGYKNHIDRKLGAKLVEIQNSAESI